MWVQKSRKKWVWKVNTGNPVKCAFEKGKCFGSIINDLVIFVEIIQ